MRSINVEIHNEIKQIKIYLTYDGFYVIKS